MLTTYFIAHYVSMLVKMLKFYENHCSAHKLSSRKTGLKNQEIVLAPKLLKFGKSEFQLDVTIIIKFIHCSFRRFWNMESMLHCISSRVLALISMSDTLVAREPSISVTKICDFRNQEFEILRPTYASLELFFYCLGLYLWISRKLNSTLTSNLWNQSR